MRLRFATLSLASAAGVVAAISCGGDLDLTGPGSGSHENPLIGADCGAERPQKLDPCGTEGAICGWHSTDEATLATVYDECACREAAQGDLRWHCYEHAVSQGQCPEAQPERGSSCFGYYGASCRYPERVECLCRDEAGVGWECEAPEPRPDYLDPPSEPSPERLITELDDADRAAWCDWFVAAAAGPGYVERVDAVVDENGYTQNTSCSYGAEAFPCNAAVGAHSRRQCAENLALSSCEAPLSELTDCVATVYSQACAPLEHGCARFFDKPGCSGTIVVDLEENAEARGIGADSVAACAIRVR